LFIGEVSLYSSSSYHTKQDRDYCEHKQNVNKCAQAKKEKSKKPSDQKYHGHKV